jgi:RNA recognition motif-containing protein
MSSKVFIGNLAFGVIDHELRDAFAQFGVVKAEIVRDKYNGNSRGFGFVELSDADAAARAVAEMQGFELRGRPIRCEIAKGKGPNGGGNAGAGISREHVQRYRD